jgi:MFS family permease
LVAASVAGEYVVDPKRDRLVITASALGTVFEWYDFFLYGILAALLGKLFFPADNPTAATLASLAAFGAGFGVRPLGALLFGWFGDKVGRKYTFLITITLMGGATAAIGFLPTYANAGLWAPALLVLLRLLQGLALGGEYGGAAIYVAEHAPPGKRGQYTSWIQVSVVGGFLLCLVMVLSCRALLSPEQFDSWGWRIPFLASLLMLAISIYIRLKLKESPVFQAMKAAGTTARNPFVESFTYPGNIGRVLVALFGVAAGLTVIYYTSQFGTLYFLQGTARVGETEALLYMAVGAALAAPLYVGFGALSDRIGRKKILLLGYALSLVLIFPLFHMMADGANPALARATAASPVRLELPAIAISACSPSPRPIAPRRSATSASAAFPTRRRMHRTWR